MSNPCRVCTSDLDHKNCIGCYNKRNFEPIPTAASAWRTDSPPTDGTWILRNYLGKERKIPMVVKWSRKWSWAIGGGAWYTDDDDPSFYSEEQLSTEWAEILPYKE